MTLQLEVLTAQTNAGMPTLEDMIGVYGLPTCAWDATSLNREVFELGYENAVGDIDLIIDIDPSPLQRKHTIRGFGIYDTSLNGKFCRSPNVFSKDVFKAIEHSWARHP